jgi:DNA-binding MarR family transcriptional regulator
MRRRNAILQTVEDFRRLHPTGTLTHLSAFLYICENEGLNVSELAELCGATRATASRVAAALGPLEPGAVQDGLGLIRASRSPRERHSKLLFLTDAGRAFAREVDALILDGRTIAPPPRNAA